MNPRGFFQFDTVAPGEYVLEVSQPPFATTSTTVQVLPDRVTEVVDPPLLLEFPKRLEVVIQPPTTPDGSAWTLALRRLEASAGTSEAIVEGQAVSMEGHWHLDGLEPGRYLFELASSGSRWHTEEVELDGPETRVFVDLDVVEVKGEVLLGKEPLPAKLTFGGRYGTERIRAQADEEGRFETFLPRPGTWKVLVESEVPALDREVAAVPVERSSDGSPTELSLLLPNTVVAGRVVNEDGEAAATALVSARSLLKDGRRERVQVRVQKGGSFLLEGLAEGPTELSATGPGDQTSEVLTLELTEDRAAKDVVLTLKKQRRVGGFIVSNSGPVPGARIKAVPLGVAVSGVATVTSGADGGFELSVPPATREVFLTIGPPGFGLRMLRLTLPTSGPLALRADPAAGTLRLEAEEPLQGEPGQAMVVLFHGGAYEGLNYLLSWAAATSRLVDPVPEVAVIPALEPGDYRACWVKLDEMLGLAAGLPPRGPCVSGTLVPGGELVLGLGNRQQP
ncbi:MAG: carboxypeptidase-like regulatory domain-containing protein [Thermoanaerobaculia bacterium]|nr:carboxypeptidase-like regulatory domain-containing protein [Thermoanaerobaculia bacterium]